MHGRARPPGACTTASPATLVLPALSSLSCSRDSHTRRAAFLVVEHYWGQKLVATGSLEQALISSMGGLLISRGRHRKKRGALQFQPRAGLVAQMARCSSLRWWVSYTNRWGALGRAGAETGARPVRAGAARGATLSMQPADWVAVRRRTHRIAHGAAARRG